MIPFLLALVDAGTYTAWRISVRNLGWTLSSQHGAVAVFFRDNRLALGELFRFILAVPAPQEWWGRASSHDTPVVRAWEPVVTTPDPAERTGPWDPSEKKT